MDFQQNDRPTFFSESDKTDFELTKIKPDFSIQNQNLVEEQP